MYNYFGKNAWSNGPPRPDGGVNRGPGPGPGPGPNSGHGSGSGGARVLVAGGVGGGQGVVSRSAAALMYQRKKREENRSNYQESLKRDVVKEKNYLIFQLREGVGSVSFDEIGNMLDELKLTAADVVSIAGNPYNSSEIEVLLKDETTVEIATFSKKLDDIGAPVTVNRMGKLEEVLIIRNLPLTLNQDMVKKWISEAVSPFVEEIHDIIPLKHSRRQLANVGERASKFFEGKFDGNWRVSVTPKGSAEVPSFAAFGPDNLQGTVKYSKRVQSVNELCWSCYSPGHKRSDQDDDGKYICSGPKEWNKYVQEFQAKAVDISGKSAEDLFEFKAGGPIVDRLEKQISDIAEQCVKLNKEKEDNERALAEAQEKVQEAVKERDEHWQNIVSNANKRIKDLETGAAGLNQLKEDVDLMKVKLDESQRRNKELKEEVLEMKKENEKLQAQSVEDAMDLADISSTNEDLVSMVTRGSTLDDEKESIDSSVVQMQENFGDNNEIIHDKTDSGAGKKHSLSPASIVSGPPQGKHLVRTNSIGKSVIKSTSDVENPPTPNPSPPGFNPPPPETNPPPAPRKSPINSIFRPIGKGAMVEIFDETSGNITAKIISCQVKRSHKEYQKFKDHWNVQVIKGNDVFKAGDENGFDLSNIKSYKIINSGSAQQSSTLAPRESRDQLKIVE